MPKEHPERLCLRPHWNQSILVYEITMDELVENPEVSEVFSLFITHFPSFFVTTPLSSFGDPPLTHFQSTGFRSWLHPSTPWVDIWPRLTNQHHLSFWAQYLAQGWVYDQWQPNKTVPKFLFYLLTKKRHLSTDILERIWYKPEILGATLLPTGEACLQITSPKQQS